MITLSMARLPPQVQKRNGSKRAGIPSRRRWSAERFPRRPRMRTPDHPPTIAMREDCLKVSPRASAAATENPPLASKPIMVGRARLNPISAGIPVALRRKATR